MGKVGLTNVFRWSDRDKILYYYYFPKYDIDIVTTYNNKNSTFLFFLLKQHEYPF